MMKPLKLWIMQLRDWKLIWDSFMPLYDFKCINCGTVEEKLLATALNFTTQEKLEKKQRAWYEEQSKGKHPGYEIIFIVETPKNFQTCDNCGGPQEVQVPLTNMQPDDMWSGRNTERGYYTSKSEYLQELKNKNIESVSLNELSNINRNAKKARQEKREKQLNNLTEHIHKELAGVEISPDGNTVSEKRKYARKRKND